MDIGLNLWVWGAPVTDDRVEDELPRAAEMGFDVVEFPIEERDGFDYSRAGEVVERHGLDASVVVAMTENRDLLADSHTTRENGREYIRHCVDAAEVLGADRVVGPLYSAVGRTWRLSEPERAKAMDDLVDQLGSLATYAGNRGVSLCVEPLNRFETSVLNTTEQAIPLIDRVDDPACKLLLDTFHMAIEEKSLPVAIRRAGDRLGHLHACANDRGAPGNDHLDWRGIAAALEEIGYDDQAVIESFTPEVESIARAAAIWRPIEESQEKLARNGQSFLGETFQ